MPSSPCRQAAQLATYPPQNKEWMMGDSFGAAGGPLSYGEPLGKSLDVLDCGSCDLKVAFVLFSIAKTSAVNVDRLLQCLCGDGAHRTAEELVGFLQFLRNSVK